MADIVTENMREIYPDAGKVQSVATATLRELRRTNAPAVLVEVGYHDNVDDAEWIKENIPQIAEALARSIVVAPLS